MIEPRLASFIASWQDRTDNRRVATDLVLGLAYQAFVLAFSLLSPLPDAARLVLGLSAVTMALLDAAAAVAVKARRFRLAGGLFAVANVGTNLGLLATILTLRLVHAEAMHVVAMQAFALMLVPVAMLLSHFRGRAIAVAVALNVAGMVPSCFVLYDGGFVDSWLGLFLVVTVLSGFYRRSMTLLEIRTATLEYERLRNVTPPAIIDSVIASPTGAVDDSFRPTERTCVCICSDWRSYQKMTAGMSSAGVVHALETYYAATDALLERCFPRGNYFSDWIADELFVVAFALDDGDGRQLARESLAFAKALVDERARNAAAASVPEAIDVGVAMGTASVGLMGPPRHRKATALGETPGRSRRLQTAAKHLREAYGERDRVVVDGGVADLLAGEWAFATHALNAGAKVKDLDDGVLFYLDGPAAGRQAA